MKVPAPEAILVAKLPCIVIVLVAVLPGWVQDTVIATVLLFIIAGPKLPLRVAPTPKHGERFSPLKLRVLAEIVVLLWVKLKLNIPGCG